MSHILHLPSRSSQPLSVQDEHRSRRFGISKVALDMEGLVTSVLWEKMGHAANESIAPEAVVSVKVVVAAIRDGHPVVAIFPGSMDGLPERRFVVEERGWKGATVVLEGMPSPGRNLHDLYMLFLEGPGTGASPAPLRGH